MPNRAGFRKGGLELGKKSSFDASNPNTITLQADSTGKLYVVDETGQSTEVGSGSGGGTQITATTIDVSAMELSGGIPTSLVPDASGAYDLGSAERPWRELYLVGNTIYMDGEPLSVQDNRLLFGKNNKKTIAFTEEISGAKTEIQQQIYYIDSKTDALSASSGMETVDVIQELHGFKVGDPVKTNSGDNGILNVKEDHNQWGSRGLVIDESQPYSLYQGNGSYHLYSLGGSLNWNDSRGRGFSTHSKTFNQKFGEMSATFHSLRNVNDREQSYVGLFVAPKYDFTRMRMILIKPDNENPPKHAIQEAYYDESLNIDYGSYAFLGSGVDSIDLKIETVSEFGKIKVHTAYKNTNSDNWIYKGYNYNTDIDTYEEYRIGLIWCGGYYYNSYSGSWKCHMHAYVKDFRGSLSSPINDVVWVEAGGSESKHDFASGIVVDVKNNNAFKVATAGVAKIDNFFDVGVEAYLDQETKGSIIYTKPKYNPQLLYKGIDKNRAKLILNSSVDGVNVETDNDNNTSLLPETSGSNLGSDEKRWNSIYTSGDVYIGEQGVLATVTQIENEVAAFSATLSGAALSYNIEGSSSSLNSDQIVSFTTVDYEFDEEGLESGGQYTVQVDGVYKFECDMTSIVSAGSITNSGLRINGSFVTGFSTGAISTTDANTISKTRILQLSVGDTIDWYHTDSTNDGTTYSGWWCIHKL